MIVEIQGIVIGVVAGVFSVVLSLFLHNEEGSVNDALLTVACSVITAALSSLILGVFMCAVIVASRRYRVNPDNIATPLAATLGDIVTLGVMAGTAIVLEWMRTALQTS